MEEVYADPDWQTAYKASEANGNWDKAGIHLFGRNRLFT
jgi:hypothetical protein